VFAQVACGKCGKPFQVPEAQLGQSVVCSWCRESVTAVPLSGIVPEALPDDSPALPRPRLKRPWLAPVLVTLLSGLALVVAYVGSAYYRGGVPGFVWQRFEAPDGTCRVDLPGRVTEEELPADPKSPITLSGKKFTASSTFTRVGGFVGWYDLDPRPIQMTRPEDVLAAERERRKAETGWAVETESTSARVGGFDLLEVQFADGSAKYVERYVFVTKGPHKRLYVLGVGGGHFDPAGEDAKRVLNSFWFDETK
jgi:hypothetical protein